VSEKDELYPPHPDSEGYCHSMRALLMVAIKEAVKLALIDSIVLREPDPETGQSRGLSDEERRACNWDVYQLPEGDWTFDPGALAQNVACRLLGKGDWTARGVYAGNATPQEILDATIERPRRDPLGDIKMWLSSKGLREGPPKDEA
jgi:hypothetical protein